MVRFGHKLSKQRYNYKDCLKSFIRTSKTSLENSHSDESAWKTVIADTLAENVSLKTTAKKQADCLKLLLI